MASTVTRGIRAMNSFGGGPKKADTGCRALVVGLWFPGLRGVLSAEFSTFTGVQG